MRMFGTKASDATRIVQNAIFARTGISLSFDAANTLRRAEMALRGWGVQMCNGDVVRDEGDGQTYRQYGGGAGPFITRRCADKETGAIRRIAAVCKDSGLHYFHQTDPRGCALYVSTEVLNDSNYNRGVAVCS